MWIWLMGAFPGGEFPETEGVVMRRCWMEVYGEVLRGLDDVGRV